MGLFDSAEELQRKAHLKRLEDKRLAFAELLAEKGFAPEKMLFSQNENGGFTALSRFRDKYWVIVSPGFGTDEEFRLEVLDSLNWRSEEVHVKSEGLGGIFGMGKKAEIGREYIITLPDGTQARMPFVCGRNSWLVAGLKKNPLIKTRRRKGDANLVWEMTPLDRTSVEKTLESVAAFFPG
ncbi:MAG: hypothetical protein IJH38_06535 [Clostridia bacterium]|nr:hypothetical protein [Clostridia bacterium]